MGDLVEYRLWCNNTTSYEYVIQDEDLPAPTTCPADPVGHTIDAAKTNISRRWAEKPVFDDDGVALERLSTATRGYNMCNRDICVSTAKVAQEDAIKDFKVNQDTYALEDWGEVDLVGCFKIVSGTEYVPCLDQADADLHACLTIMEYTARHQDPTFSGTEIPYDLRGGALDVDPVLDGDPWAHQIYSIAAPDIPEIYGGVSRFFDGYLKPWAGKTIMAINPAAIHLDPTASPAAAVLRTWFYYPSGTQNNHVLRLVTYRQPGTM